MVTIPREYYKNDTVHRSFGTDPRNGILSCGFLHKGNQSDLNIVFQYYGALLLLDGKGLHIDNEGREYPLYPGCFIQRIPGRRHSTIAHPDNRWLEFYICFGRDLFNVLTDLKILDAQHDVLYPGVTQAMFKTFTDYLAKLKEARDEDLPDLLIEAQQIIVDIYRMHRDQTTDGERQYIIREACLALSNDTSGKLSIEQLAKELGIGYESFRKLFRQYTGTAPYNYAMMKRMDKARSMLINQGISIKLIASELGFPDIFSFSRQFKRVVGVSPSEFRKNR